MFFGYTHCPDVCPTTLAEFRLAKADLGEELAQNVVFLFVSVDGPRDTADVMASFLDRFDSDFLGMSGDDETLHRIAPQYGLYYERQTDTGSEAAYLVDHTGRSYLIDRDGRLRISYAYGTDSEVLADGIRQLMSEDRT
jgi:protein SCO1/2